MMVCRFHPAVWHHGECRHLPDGRVWRHQPDTPCPHACPCLFEGMEREDCPHPAHHLLHRFGIHPLHGGHRQRGFLVSPRGRNGGRTHHVTGGTLLVSASVLSAKEPRVTRRFFTTLPMTNSPFPLALFTPPPRVPLP